jgi:hypothetical protein
MTARIERLINRICYALVKSFASDFYGDLVRRAVAVFIGHRPSLAEPSVAAREVNSRWLTLAALVCGHP